MANQPKTPLRSLRVPEALWAAAREKSAFEGRTVTDVILEALHAYVTQASGDRASGGERK